MGKVTYELHLHRDQGNDFADCLESTDSISDALAVWAEQFDYNAEVCRELSRRMAWRDVEVNVDTHTISFYGDEELLEDLAKNGPLVRVDTILDYNREPLSSQGGVLS